MITIKKISKNALPDLVKISYEGDAELIEKYHPAKSDEQGSIDNTLEMVNDMAKIYDCSYYKVCVNKKPVGYFVVFENFLYSFCINIKYRRKEILIKWWQEIKSVLGKTFRTMLYTENHRAISFCLKNGMKVEGQRDNIVTLINKSA